MITINSRFRSNCTFMNPKLNYLSSINPKSNKSTRTHTINYNILNLLTKSNIKVIGASTHPPPPNPGSTAKIWNEIWTTPKKLNKNKKSKTNKKWGIFTKCEWIIRQKLLVSHDNSHRTNNIHRPCPYIRYHRFLLAFHTYSHPKKFSYLSKYIRTRGLYRFTEFCM